MPQMRYSGQGFEILVDLPSGPIDADYIAKLIDAFRAAYLRKNKFLDDDGVVEGVDWALVAEIPRQTGRTISGAAITGAATTTRERTRQAWCSETRRSDRYPPSGSFGARCRT